MPSDKEPIFNVPPVTKISVLAMALLHVAFFFLSDKAVGALYGNLAFRPLYFVEAFESGDLIMMAREFASLTTHMFLHYDFLHLMMNAGMLVAFGSLVERAFGSVKFAVMFVLCGWAGAFAELMVVNIETDPYMYGASAGVFGMMGAAAILLLPKMGIRGIAGFVGVLMGINLLIGLTPLGNMLVGPSADIAWAAHIGGFAAGFFMCLLLRSKAVHE